MRRWAGSILNFGQRHALTMAKTSMWKIIHELYRPSPYANRPDFCVDVCFEMDGLQDAKRTRPTVEFDGSCGPTFAREVDLQATILPPLPNSAVCQPYDFCSNGTTRLEQVKRQDRVGPSLWDDLRNESVE